MGTHHARVFGRRAAFVGAYDVRPERAEAVVRAYGGVTFGSADEAVARADLVVIATPTPSHQKDAALALSAGRHVLVEKPLCATPPDAWELCALARENAVRLFVGHSERFNPVVRAIARATNEEPLVELVTQRLLRTPCRYDEPCLNLAVHDIDLAAFLSRGRVELESATSDGPVTDLALRMRDGRALVKVGCHPTPLRWLTVSTSLQVHTGDLTMPHCVDDEPLALQADAVLDALHGHPSAVAMGNHGAEAVSLAYRAATLIADARVSAAE